MESLVDDFSKPIIEPTSSFEVTPDLVAYKITKDKLVSLQIFRRNNQTFGFRYIAWVAWRDAGDEVRSHSWHEIQQKDNPISDSLIEMQKIAEYNASKKDIEFSEAWIHVI